MVPNPSRKLNCRLGLHPPVVGTFGDEHPLFRYECEYQCGWHEGNWNNRSFPAPMSVTTKFASFLSRLGLV